MLHLQMLLKFSRNKLLLFKSELTSVEINASVLSSFPATIRRLHSLTSSRLLVRRTHGCPSSRIHPSPWCLTALHGLLPHKLFHIAFRPICSFNLHNIPYGRELHLIACRKRTWFQAFQPIISSDTLSSWIRRNSNHAAFTCSRPDLSCPQALFCIKHWISCATLLFSFLLTWHNPCFFAGSFCFDGPK